VEHGEGWDERYAAVGRRFSIHPDTAMVELVTPLPPGQALDLGAGEGRNSLWLARHGWTVTAVDGSSVALDRMRAAADAEGLSVSPVQADLGDFLRRGDTFDLVVIANIHPSPEERVVLLRAAVGAVRPGGHLFLVGHHVDSLGRVGPLDAARLYTEEALGGALPGLRTLLLERRERTLGGDTGEPVVDVVLWAAAPESLPPGRPA
jgi:SAM-dependent methyltransferase